MLERAQGKTPMDAEPVMCPKCHRVVCAGLSGEYQVKSHRATLEFGEFKRGWCGRCGAYWETQQTQSG